MANEVGPRKVWLKGAADMRIEYLYRYPVKGLTAEALDEAEVEAGQAIPWDGRSRWRTAMQALIRPIRPGCRNGTSSAR